MMKKLVNYIKTKGWLLAFFPMASLYACGPSNSSSQQDYPQDNAPADSGYVAIFDGKTLNGWEGDTAYWHVEDGQIIGERKASDEPLTRNTFLIWKEDQPADFELKLLYKISSEGNSGVNYRSEPVEDVPHALKGYQADIDGQNNYTGQNYEERKRTTLAYRGQVVEIPEDNGGESKGNAWSNVLVKDTLGDLNELKKTIKENDWNELHILAKGNRLQHYINGVLMSDVLDNDTKNGKKSGLIGVQIHVGPPMQVAFKDIQLKTLK